MQPTKRQFIFGLFFFFLSFFFPFAVHSQKEKHNHFHRFSVVVVCRVVVFLLLIPASRLIERRICVRNKTRKRRVSNNEQSFKRERGNETTHSFWNSIFCFLFFINFFSYSHFSSGGSGQRSLYSEKKMVRFNTGMNVAFAAQ